MDGHCVNSHGYNLAVARRDAPVVDSFIGLNPDDQLILWLILKARLAFLTTLFSSAKLDDISQCCFTNWPTVIHKVRPILSYVPSTAEALTPKRLLGGAFLNCNRLGSRGCDKMAMVLVWTPAIKRLAKSSPRPKLGAPQTLA